MTPPGGVTGLALLSESHLACHTYPEFGVATFNLYCCRARPRWNWEAVLAEMLGATSVTVRVLERRAAFARGDDDGDDDAILTGPLAGDETGEQPHGDEVITRGGRSV